MKFSRFLFMAGAALVFANTAIASNTVDEANRLKSELTPFGAERAGNTDGTIPKWEGGYTTVDRNYRPNGKRSDPFAAEKPILSITANNYKEHANRLIEGQQAMFAKYPDYRIDVYPTHRTAAAPQWVYDNTYRNAQEAKVLKEGAAVQGAYGGVPFPIPANGNEAMWNHMLRWQGEAYTSEFSAYNGTSTGRTSLTSTNTAYYQFPYYIKDGRDTFNGIYRKIKLLPTAPPLQAGQSILGFDPLDPLANGRPTWQYLTGQRRTRKLPNAAYDTPSFVTSGQMNYDEVYIFEGPMNRYSWKLIGKQELYVPYNNNKNLQPTKDSDVLGANFLNPDYVRWELHRVWVVEAELIPGNRHVMPKRKFYLDEDTWQAVLADNWDAKGKLWKTAYMLNIVAPELPGVVNSSFGVYDLQTGNWFANNVFNSYEDQITFHKPWPDSFFSPDSLASEGVR
ncbi:MULTISPECIES: DUF1329 domain-containing protein [Pseudomonas]|uniref:DUF1329 domain-containing protein n=7 Tax=Pseudomonas gessardii TaxID=78544 RepID=A0ABS9FCF9_9PSED|nr:MULTISPECIES: DUF1329 domain-containing protein [Pseudomonas]MCF5110040.1 DUF1329 domain-containing protein [Pseudomonas gessardii]PHN61451.1 hypothetical protein AO268_12425 [Pseudomonas sp. ICMP 8385]